jgi:hypothetical protein
MENKLDGDFLGSVKETRRTRRKIIKEDIYRNVRITWPARSPNFNPVEITLGGCVKSRMCHNSNSDNRQQLEDSRIEADTRIK